MPRVRIEPEAGGEVVIRLDEETGERWYALAACMACWAYEDACKRRSRPKDDPLRLAMYRECLLNQVASLAVRRDRQGRLASPEEALLDAVEDGFLEAIVFWEVVAPRAPAVMLLLPERLRGDIELYIERYVFESTRVVNYPYRRGKRIASR